MIDFRTWWKFREGKEITITIAVIAVVLLGLVIFAEPERKHPDICTNLCIIDKNGIPRYEKWFKDHPEDRPQTMFIY